MSALDWQKEIAMLTELNERALRKDLDAWFGAVPLFADIPKAPPSAECRFKLQTRFGDISIIPDPQMPPNSFEVRSGVECVRVRWPDPATELDRWADDGGRA